MAELQTILAESFVPSQKAQVAMKDSYSPPSLETYGSASQLTRANSAPNQQDAIFDQGEQIDTSTGSINACSTPDQENCS